jgi:hypothetical protein
LELEATFNISISYTSHPAAVGREFIAAIYQASAVLKFNEAISETAQAKIARIILGWEFPATDKFMTSGYYLLGKLVR